MARISTSKSRLPRRASIWAKTISASSCGSAPQPPGTPSIVDKRDHAALGYLIFIYQGHPGFQIGNGGNPDGAVAQSVSLAGNGWHHMVKRLPPEHFGIYVDGVKQPQVSIRTAPLVNLDVPTPLWLGRHHTNSYVPARISTLKAKSTS